MLTSQARTRVARKVSDFLLSLPDRLSEPWMLKLSSTVEELETCYLLRRAAMLLSSHSGVTAAAGTSYVEAARLKYKRDNRIEVDEDAAVIPFHEDKEPGAFVLAWVWVKEAELAE